MADFSPSEILALGLAASGPFDVQRAQYELDTQCIGKASAGDTLAIMRSARIIQRYDVDTWELSSRGWAYFNNVANARLQGKI